MDTTITTSFDEIYDLALVTLQDYRIDKIYDPDDLTDFRRLMYGYLVKAIPKFHNCIKDLADIDTEDNKFSEVLTLKEKVILSDLLVIEWMNSKILDIRQMQLHLNDTDFKHYSEAQNLDSKLKLREILREAVNHEITGYGFDNVDWDKWGEGVF